MVKCVICGKEIEKSKYYDTILCSSECFSTNYWNEYAKDMGYRNVIIDGKAYYINSFYSENDDRKSSWKGFSGRKFTIKKHSGEIVITEDLIFNGDIPDNFKEIIKDNAEFIKPEEDKISQEVEKWDWDMEEEEIIL